MAYNPNLIFTRKPNFKISASFLFGFLLQEHFIQNTDLILKNFVLKGTATFPFQKSQTVNMVTSSSKTLNVALQKAITTPRQL